MCICMAVIALGLVKGSFQRCIVEAAQGSRGLLLGFVTWGVVGNCVTWEACIVDSLLPETESVQSLPVLCASWPLS